MFLPKPTWFHARSLPACTLLIFQMINQALKFLYMDEFSNHCYSVWKLNHTAVFHQQKILFEIIWVEILSLCMRVRVLVLVSVGNQSFFFFSINIILGEKNSFEVVSLDRYFFFHFAFLELWSFHSYHTGRIFSSFFSNLILFRHYSDRIELTT